MRFIFVFTFFSVFTFGGAHAESESSRLTDEEVAQVLIRRSLSGYSGSCPCPYNITASGRKCGKRSAWSKPGGYEPLCYRSDVSDKMIEVYRKRHRG